MAMKSQILIDGLKTLLVKIQLNGFKDRMSLLKNILKKINTKKIYQIT